MRLLKYDSAGQLSLTEDFIGNDIPEYAILSHTWGTKNEEVIFQDLMNGTGKKKSGYKKIRLCGDQAKRDGLQYFWVDTCCIDKTSSAVLAEAIISMFRWYQKAARCYVYLSDVSRPAFNKLGSEFAKSRWFTRGWTLQELLAPASVKFFSKEWKVLGDKKSLEQVICQITGIPERAIRGSPLSDFTVKERISWAKKRKTTMEEDNAYSLQGIFNVSMPVLYGEGRKNAFVRLCYEIGKTSIGSDRFPSTDDSFFNVNINTPRTTPRRRATTSFGNLSAGSEIRCFRCDYPHVLNKCFANVETVREARTSRMNSGQCYNCGKVGHYGKYCNLENLLWKRR